jgi:N-acetylmuramoyl-L-alanine amidase
VLLLASLPQAQNRGPISVVSQAGRRTLPTTAIGDQDFVALEDVAAFLPLTIRDDRQGGLTIGVRGKTIIASPDRPLVSVDGRVVALPAPLTRAGGRWLAPIDFVPRALGLLSDQRVEYRRASRLLLLGNVRVPRVTIRVDASATSGGAGARVNIDVAPPAQVSSVVDGDRILIQVEGDALDLAPASGTSPLVAQVRAGDQPTTVAITLTPAAGSARATTSTSDASTHVAVDITAADQPADTAAVPRPVTVPPALVAPKAGLQTVILDPGHGGDDLGVRGAGGTQEKQITLDIARRAKALLESRMGVRVVLTRDEDRAVGLDERTAIANNGKGELFVSLHMNGSPAAATTGASVFFMRLDREGDEARREAGAEALALPVLGGGMRVIETILWDLAQARHVDDSARLANLLVSALEGRVAVAAQPVQAVPLRVLAGLNMPAILIEMGYLTNPEQEKRAGTDDYRLPLVQAIYEAVNQFAADIDGPR